MENREDITFSTKISEQDLYRYNIHHAYTSSQGIFSIIVSVLLLAAWIMQFQKLSSLYMILYPVIAILFLVYIPFNLKLKVKQQMMQDVFAYPLTYTFKESGVEISSPTTEEAAVLPWEYIYKASTWKDYLLIYTNRVNAYIIPKADIENMYGDVVDYIKNHVEDYRFNIKR